MRTTLNVPSTLLSGCTRRYDATARAGVNTGEVVVRSIKTGSSHTEYTPIGHTVNLASRLQALAGPGTTIISDATRRLVDGYFALLPLTRARVKGVSEALNLYQVSGLGPLRSRLERSAGRGLSKFVGREAEKATFRQAAERANSGSGQIVAVEAEPGVGKSRLFFEFKNGLTSDWVVAQALSVSHGKASPYLTVVELLYNFLGTGPEDNFVVRGHKIAAKLEELGSDQADLPYLGALLEIEEDKLALGAMDPQLRRSRTIEAVTRLFASQATKRPLVLIVEDLHWLDGESEALLDRLAATIDRSRILLLVNYRPEYSLKWTDSANCHWLRLEPLSRESAAEMLGEMLGSGVHLEPLKQLIIETTDGTPFFMEETVQSLFDEGALDREAGAARLVKPLGSLRIPPTVQAILAARIDRLHNDEKNLLQTLAVLGREFVLSLARAVAGRSERDLERLIANLQNGEFVYEQPSISDVEYIFKHALTQEVAYNSVLVERRRQLHESVGHAIELLYSASLEDHVAELAHHFSRSGNRKKAVEYLRLAGLQALSRGASAQTVQNLEAALVLLEETPQGAWRDQTELAILNGLGTAYIAVMGYAAPEVGPIFQRAREIASTAGDPQQQFGMIFGNFAWRVVRGEMDRSLALASEAMSFAEHANDAGIWMEATFLLGVTLYYRGDFVGARAQYDRALAEFDDRQRNRLWAGRVGEDAGVTHRCYLALALWQLGQPEQALRVNREARELALAIEHPFSIAYAYHHTSWLYQMMRLPAETLVFSDEQKQISAEQGFPLFSATAAIYSSAGKILQGRLEHAVEELEAGLDSYRDTGAGLALPYYLGLLADALIRTGKYRDAQSALDEALLIVDASGDRCYEAELHRLRGDLARQEGADDAAEASYLRAREIARTQWSKAWELRTSTSLARLYVARGSRGQGFDVLSRLCVDFDDFITPDLRNAKALLRELQSA